MTLTIDNEFKNLIPPLTPDERKGLEESILSEGCRDALIAWNGVLVDGHNRYEICEKYGLPYAITETDFASRDAVIEWIIKNQFSRRNLPLYPSTLKHTWRRFGPFLPGMPGAWWSTLEPCQDQQRILSGNEP